MPTEILKDMKREVVTAPLRLETASLSEVAKVLGLPEESARQPDLQYLTAIFVSSGMNKNGAVFMGSELVKARSSIANKAVDIEHDEQKLIGHITNAAYFTREGSVLDAEAASTGISIEEMDKMEMDVGISAIIHKARFPEVANEVKEGGWMVSMEAYYRDYDVKVGDLIIPRDQAVSLGYDKLVGQVVHVKDGTKEKGFHLVGRVLRDIIFAGVGLVKNPANERSVILEAASMNEYIERHKENASVVNLADIAVLDIQANASAAENNLGTLKEELLTFIKETVKEEVRQKNSPEVAGLVPSHLTPGTCVSYKRFVAEMPNPNNDPLPEPPTDLSQYPLSHQPGGDAYPPGTRIVAEHHCNLFDKECSARPGDATMPTCWRNVFARTVREEINSHEDVLRQRRVDEGLISLQELIDQARELIQ